MTIVVKFGSSGTPLPQISRSIQASLMKLCTDIVLINPYQNTLRNFQRSEL